MTGLPISCFLVKYHSEMKCFFVQQKRKCLQSLNHYIDSPYVLKDWELPAVQCRQQETLRRFCETLFDHIFVKCNEMS